MYDKTRCGVMAFQFDFVGLVIILFHFMSFSLLCIHLFLSSKQNCGDFLLI